jgi:voltage-gated potassium channel
MMKHVSERLSDSWRTLSRKSSLLWRDLWRENVPQLAMALFALFMIAAVVVGTVEYFSGNSFGGVLNTIYWSIITLSTTGYGDYAPVSALGRMLTLVFTLVGMGTVAVFTATLASVFTAKKIKEDRGLEKIKAVGHVVICGWSRHLESVLRVLSRSDQYRDHAFVLINGSAEAEMNEVLYRFNHLDISHVHGDFLQESVLRRANMEKAQTAILVSDELHPDPATGDNRTLQAVLAIKELNPDIELIAEARDVENEQHLRRAQVDGVIVSGEFTGYMMAASALSPSLYSAIHELFSVDVGNDLIKNPIPPSLHGKTFADVHSWFRDSGALVIGIITEEPGLSLDNILVDDFSTIDRFIRQAFTAAGKDLSVQGQGRSSVALNPPDDRQIGPNDHAIVIASHQLEV